jgi:NADP-reducing hydrogenase subunit HndB
LTGDSPVGKRQKRIAMVKLTKEDLKIIKDKVLTESTLKEDGHRARITVHMGTCGIASGAKEVMNTLMAEIEDSGVKDVAVTTSGCMGMCSREPLVTVERIGQEPIKYERMDAEKIKQVFKEHLLQGKVQMPFVLARGAEIAE